MTMITTKEANEWLLTHWSRDFRSLNRQAMELRTLPVPKASGDILYLAKSIAWELGEKGGEGETLFIVLDRTIWPSSSLEFVYDRFLASYTNEPVDFDAQPGVLVPEGDLYARSIEGLLVLALLSGWDFVLADRRKETIVVGSHDEFLDLAGLDLT